MDTNQSSQQQARAIRELSAQCPNLPSTQIVDSLSVGLSHLRNLLIARIHEDVEQLFGKDSMFAPVSKRVEAEQVLNAEIEIDIYSVVIVADEINLGGYADCPGQWILDWLLKLRLAEGNEPAAALRVDEYRNQSSEDRRLRFLSVLERAMPEAAKTPLVLFRLFPRAVRIVTAMAFDDRSQAQRLRAQQQEFLPAISDCQACHGRLLDNGELCRQCGNPVWKLEWLRAD